MIITQHVPGFIDAEQKTARFETAEELLAIDWVENWTTILRHAEFGKSQHHEDTWLIIVDGFDLESGIRQHWVVGDVEHGEQVGLPIWKLDDREWINGRT